MAGDTSVAIEVAESDDSGEELPPEWEVRTDNDGRVYYAK